MLLEGSSIDELLARVRAEHGADAEIVHAQERLVGGVGGFFARRRYEVAVQVNDDETGAGAGQLGQEQAMTGSSSGPSGGTAGSPLAGTIYDALQDALRGGPATPASPFEDLLSVADGQDGAGASPAGSRPAGSAGSSAAAAAAPEDGAPDTTFRPASYVPATALSAQPDAAEPTVPHRPVSTETPGFEALLRDLMHQRELALQDEAAPAPAEQQAAVPVPPSPAPAGPVGTDHRPWSMPTPMPAPTGVRPWDTAVPAVPSQPTVAPVAEPAVQRAAQPPPQPVAQPTAQPVAQ
ncbi:MAG TPA: hypothetical protein VKB14_14475, partial [Actinomycetales bacterium]|nr:hypothetical protein [Actinomycetales bacterium]